MDRRRLRVILEEGGCKKHLIWRKTYPPFQFFYFNERLDFLHLKIKIKYQKD